ncbi:MAG: hypothetical protein ACKOQ0_05430, partial [Solirubrobacterales bacterium]
MTQAVSEPSFLAERRAAAQDTLAGLELPSFRGVAGWEFTPVDDLVLEDWEPAPGGRPGSALGPLSAPEG